MKADATSRERNIRVTTEKLVQAMELLDALSSTPNQPICIDTFPIHGIRVLEKLGVIETWENPIYSSDPETDNPSRYWAITKK